MKTTPKAELLKQIHALIWKSDDLMLQENLFALQTLVDQELCWMHRAGEVTIHQRENGYIFQIDTPQAPSGPVLSVETENTGGGCMVDVIRLRGGSVIAMNDESGTLLESLKVYAEDPSETYAEWLFLPPSGSYSLPEAPDDVPDETPLPGAITSISRARVVPLPQATFIRSIISDRESGMDHLLLKDGQVITVGGGAVYVSQSANDVKGSAYWAGTVREVANG